MCASLFKEKIYSHLKKIILYMLKCTLPTHSKIVENLESSC